MVLSSSIAAGLTPALLRRAMAGVRLVSSGACSITCFQFSLSCSISLPGCGGVEKVLSTGGGTGAGTIAGSGLAGAGGGVAGGVTAFVG